MLHAYVQRFDVTGKLKKFGKILGNYTGSKPNQTKSKALIIMLLLASVHCTADLVALQIAGCTHTPVVQDSTPQHSTALSGYPFWDRLAARHMLPCPPARPHLLPQAPAAATASTTNNSGSGPSQIA